MKIEAIEQLLSKVNVTNVGEMKEDDLLVFQFDYKKTDAHILGTFMKMIKEQGVKAIAIPTTENIVDKKDIKTTIMMVDMLKEYLAKLDVEQ